MRLHLFPLALLVVAQVCAAGGLYRVVGPDGKVSYTDRPPSTEGLKAVKGSEVAPSMASGGLGPAKAAAQVIVFHLIVDTTTSFCSRQGRDPSKFVARARNEWVERNAALAEKAVRVMRDALPADEQAKIAHAIAQENKALANKAETATPEIKKAWCEQAPSNFRTLRMDPSRDAAVVRTLEQYKFK